MSDIVTDPSQWATGWVQGLPETPCGLASTLKYTQTQRQWIPKIIEKYNIKTIVDVGAGDLNWIKKTDLRGADYTAYDIFPRSTEIKTLDIIKQIPPKADMIMCLWVLNHLEKAETALDNLKRSGSRYLLFTKRKTQTVDLLEIESITLGYTTQMRAKRDMLKLAVLNV